jgi:carboxyl-terminal processing protease
MKILKILALPLKKVKNKFPIIRIQILLIVVTCVLLGTTFKGNEDIYDKINRNMEVFGKVYKEVALNYVDAVDVDKFFEAGIEGMLATLDPYTVYYDDKNRDAIDLITTGRYGGIGITIGVKDSVIKVTDIMNGYEAQKKGLRIGDIIKEIDGINLNASQVDKIRQLVRGTPGTNLKMKIERDSEIIDFDLTRQEIILKNISYSGFIGDQADGIAYIKLDRFTSNSENEVENTLKTLKSKSNIKGLIFDLRDNGGGLLDAAIGILNKFVDKNSFLVTTKGNSKDSEKKLFSREEPLIPRDIPLVLLINGNTASASEIVAGAIQDLDRGVIVGSKSYGKGLVQQVKDLNSDSRLKITIARYFTPSGRWIQAKNYFKENKSGVFMNIESFQQNEFRTLNGRKVYANGGITPDIEVKVEGESEIHSVLLMKDMFFKFTNYYLSLNPGIKTFNCTDNIFEQFLDYVKSSNFDYKSEADKKLDDLQKIAQKKYFSDKYSEYLNKLDEEIQKEKDIEYIKAKDEIKRNIDAEVNKRIITEEAQIEATFENDMQLQEAIKIIKDKTEYIKILNNME